MKANRNRRGTDVETIFYYDPTGIGSYEMRSNPEFGAMIRYLTIRSIRDSLRRRRSKAMIVNVNGTQNVLVIDRPYWKQVLNRFLDESLKTEDYETCHSIKLLIDDIK